MTDKETLSDGKKITRDEYGRFVSVELSSETARAMARSKLPNKACDTTSSQLLSEAGFSPGTEPEHLKVLAEIAASKRSGAVPALRDFRRLTRVEASEPAAADNRREVVELLGGECVKIGFHLYRKMHGREVSELVRMMRSVDAEGAGGVNSNRV